MTMTKILLDIGLADREAVHGFWTSLETWTIEKKDTPGTTEAVALAHQLGASVEQAYTRSDLFDRRRVLMQQWGTTSRRRTRRQ